MNQLHLIFILCLFVSACKEKTVSSDSCGDSTVDIGEECDTLELNGENCLSLGFYGGDLACDETCSFNTSPCEGWGRCGDGVLHQAYGEQCDGDALNNATCETLGLGTGTLACATNCHYDTSSCEYGGTCGNGTLETGEQCDGADLGGTSCGSLGLGGGDLACDSYCMLDASQCEHPPFCGDGTLVPPVEECEGTDLGGTTCIDLGFVSGTLACSAQLCRFNLSGCSYSLSCGDGNIDADTEECDGENLDGQTCESQGYRAGVLSCTDGCAFDLSDCQAQGTCGDGVLDEAYEVCDGLDLGGETCITLGYSGGSLVCGDGCLTLDTSACTILATCGNGEIDTQETCDGSNLAGATCESLGYLGGELACAAGCHLDTSGCWGMVKIANGADHTCALDDLGRIWCWGGNLSMQLGVPGFTEAYSTLPQLVDHTVLTAGEHFVDVSSGTAHSCAVTSAGRVLCWGSGTNFVLDGASEETLNAPTPVTIPAMHTPVAVTSGATFNCVRTAAGLLVCWGLNNAGQLGVDTTPEDHSVPSYATDLGDTVLSSSSFGGGFEQACAVTTAGSVLCWGANGMGQLGRGTTSDAELTPAPIDSTVLPPGTTFSTLGLGAVTSCAVTTTGDAWCWGANGQGELGNGSTSVSPVVSPVLVTGGHTFTGIAAALDLTCAVDVTGTVYCWGDGESGYLGNGGWTDSAVPVAASPMVPVVFTAVTLAPEYATHVCALDSFGRPWCWGSNISGQLGTGTTNDSPRPVPLTMP